MIFGNQPRTTGRDAIQDSWDTYFSRIDESRGGSFAVVSIRMTTPEVALIEVDSTTYGHGPGGRDLPTRLARGTWVMVRRSGEWWIAAMRGLPEEGEARTAPGIDR